ncbi:MAG TPA: hypothetical protein VKK31_25330 [Thermoanaerobaculia bacterium]|nr:hypothetical protein [Thermoanaerobaculia bacterium]
MNRETRDERLRGLLREADPAAGHPGLSLDEIHEMRRTVLMAVPERRRRLLPALSLAGAATAALILMAVLLIPRPVPEPAPPPPRIAAVPVRPTPPRTIQPPPQEEPKPRAETKRTAVRRKRRAPAARPAAPPPAMQELAAAEPQQIQFSTPGGTRIVWMLSPGQASK